tara:strand:+ start:487 stop:1419 length:933 start_codon:yes stop_codon:yes gene_type:complete
MNKSYKIISLYCFSQIKKDLILNLRQELLAYDDHGLCGLIILAEEGINGTICGNEQIVNKCYEKIKKFFKNYDLNEKISFSKKRVFKKLKIKIKPEIVTMGMSNINPESKSGIYLDPNQWNSLLRDEQTIIIDTRNHYEVSLGTFANSINPNINNFREFPNWLDKNMNKLIKNNQNTNIAMFCTGGIRCEKATSLLRIKGFENVYHLKGGILKYLENISSDKNLYEGECYVFDERVALDNKLERGSYSICHACGMPLSSEDKKKMHFIEGIQCHLCVDKFTDSDRARFAERQKFIEDKTKKLDFPINKNS